MTRAACTECKPFSDLRILVVEDDYLVAVNLARLLREWGAEVVGPAATVEQARRLAAAEDVSGAILDINLKGLVSAPVADMLAHRGSPFLFVTGYASPPGLPAHLRACTRLLKPVEPDELLHAMKAMLGVE